MNLLLLTWRNLTHRISGALLSLLLLSLGVGIISLLLLIQSQLERHFTDNVKGIDMVVGAKGSPLQLILASVYHIDNPTGNISLSEADSLARNPLIARAIPLAYGDNYQGYRIVGTDSSYVLHYQATVAKGRLWKEDFEVTLGAMAAERLNLAVGDTFISTHGLAAAAEAHAEHPFRVAGILEPSGSVLDQLILTGLESVWHTHAHEGEAEEPKEITALLIHLRNPIGLFQLPRYINEETNMQAAVPAYEINRLLQKLLPGAISVIQGLALLIMAISGLSMFLSLLERLRERRYELALMRSLGASRMRLFWLLLAEGSFLSLAGCLAGLMMSRIGIVLLNLFIKDAYPYGFSPFNVLAAELWMIPAVAGMGFAAALLPAIQAFRLNLSQTLSDA